MPNMFFLYLYFFFVVILAQTNLKAHVYFYLFVQIHYMYGFRFNKRNFWHLIKFCESFSLGSSLNQSQTYQGNPYGDVYPDLSSFTGSGVIQNFVTCIKRSAPSKDHIIWYQSFDSCYRFYPIQFLFFFLFHLCLNFVFASCFIFVYILFRSYKMCIFDLLVLKVL